MKEKTINCPIHGAMRFSPLAMAIIDTPEFQRLREIRQGGSTELVFPGATNSRFQHSLGTAHLGKIFILELSRRQPELRVTESEIRCIELAGLCHDLGHGPFSHLWEIFFHKASMELTGGKCNWHHEMTSVHILRYLLKKNKIFERFPHEINDQLLLMIENIILGRIPDGCRRRFLYQIINNPDSGLDVDKWDYSMRDAQTLGVKIAFEYQHAFHGMSVMEFEGQLQICFRDKCYDIIEQSFQNRFKLHKQVYQHHKCMIFDNMLIEAIIELEKNCITQYWLTTKAIACENPSEKALENYINLNDSSIRQILRTESPLYQAMLSRSTDALMHKFAGKLRYGEAVPQKFEESLDEFGLSADEIVILPVYIHMGKHDCNPMNLVLFHRKGSDHPVRITDNDKRRVVSERSFIVALRNSDREKLQRLENAVKSFESAANLSNNQNDVQKME